MFILGEKLQQEQMITKEGIRIPITYIKTSPCYLIDVRTVEKHGYFSVLLGFGQTKNLKKPIRKQIEQAGVKTPLRFLREIRCDEQVKTVDKEGKKGIKINEAEIVQGDRLSPAVLFKKNDRVSVTGTSKGKGFAGVVKRHHFRGGPRTHGQSDRERAPGSIGQTTTPGRVYKGKRMAGRMGGETITVRGLTILDVTDDQLTVKGLVPGPRKGLLIVKSQRLTN